MNAAQTLKLPPMCKRIAKLPRNARGYPVPFFVQWIDGAPEFRIASRENRERCMKENLCWICGDRLGKTVAFVIGPMCAVNHNSGEPPSHPECALFAVQACPFLIRPSMERREDEKLAAMGATDAAGIMIKRNPGVTAIWSTKVWGTHQDGNGGTLWRFHEPATITWWRESRTATRAEVEESILTGVPFLEEVCESKEEIELLAASLMATQKLVNRTCAI